MHQQRQLPSKRYSSYLPPLELDSLEASVLALPEDPQNDNKNRCSSASDPQMSQRRRSLNTLHFDALQKGVSKLARIDDFDLEELGYGYFSDVFKVTHKLSGKVMVLKRNKSTNTKLNILREVQLMNRLSHPNILKFMGVCVHEGQLHGLTEFINGGDLDQLVQRWTVQLSWMVRIRLALDISRGLGYLHSMNIFHRDLTAKNCLVRVTTTNTGKTKYTAVVADLGLAEKIPSTLQDEAKMKVVGTPYCMAPEVLTEKPYNQQSDIFSFGIIICQLIIRTSCDPEKLPRSNDFGLAKDVFCTMMMKGMGAPESTPISDKPNLPPTSFPQLGFDCCEVDPTKRPLVNQIIQRLEKTLFDEKENRAEKKRLAHTNSQPPAKRHSAVLAELPSVTTDPSPVQRDRLLARSRTGSDKENMSRHAESRSKHLSHEHSPNVSCGRRRSSDSRLSRSYSDVSSELISFAKSMIASSREKMALDPDDSDMNSVVNSLNEAFINPFSTLDIGEEQGKLFDLPSSEVLEMTFDLPTPDHVPPSSPARARRVQMRQKNKKRAPRPSSLLLEVHGLKVNSESEKFDLTPEPSLHPLPNFSGFNPENLTYSCPQSPLSPVPPLSPDHKLEHKVRLKQAMMRSIILSPQGCRLLSWWHCHGRGTDWHSLSSVFSIMLDKMGGLRRSISLPDLSHDPSSLIAMSKNVFSPGSSNSSSRGSIKTPPPSSNIQKPPSGYRAHHPSYATLPRRKKTRNNPITPETIYKLRSRTADDVFQDPKLLEILHEETPDPRSEVVSTPLTRHKSLGAESEINNNDLTPDYFIRSISGKVDKNTSPALSSVSNVSETQDDGIVSSSSSGTSSSGLNVTIQTGVMSSNRRRRVGILCPNHPMQPPNESNDVSRKSNRDSGFNDDINFSDHPLHFSNSAPKKGEDPHPHSQITTIVPSSFTLSSQHNCKPLTCAQMNDLKLVSDSDYSPDIIGATWNVSDHNGNSTTVPLVGELR